jgi:hypothetical protein
MLEKQHFEGRCTSEMLHFQHVFSFAGSGMHA